MSKYNELVKKLKEIFQIDRPELDFGIYRILNARADEINDYLDNKLKAKIQSALADAGNANKADLEQQLQAVIKATTEAGFEPDESPKVQALKKQIAETATGASEHENAVFSHLLTFFSRYYDNGDFISKRRYKGDTYAIPYAGEEVMLHWANKDQYYIKSGENFANYSFKLDDGRKVSFKLLAADTAKDNRKDNDADRRFVLIEPHTRTKLDEDGEEYEQAYQAVEVVKTTELVNGESVENEELVIHFEYKAMKKGTKQDALVQAAITTILADSEVQQHWVELTKRAPTEKNPSRTELERHLTTYTQRNTADYFIHKDLGGFLSNELDFYIKNEVMNLDNVQNAEVFANIEKQLRMIQCLRSVALELITFLAQIENFQKKLWNKKKFVTEANFLLNLQKVPLWCYEFISSNKKQVEDWISVFGIDKYSEFDFPLTQDFLEKHKNLPVDTKHFSREEKFKLLSNIDDIDLETDGLAIHSDNYHALKIMQSRFSGKVKFTYIDPPYNTGGDGFLYKDNYKSSSWATFIYDRLTLGRKLSSEDAVTFCSIDDNERTNLSLIMDEVFGSVNHQVTFNLQVRYTNKTLSEDSSYQKVIEQVEMYSMGDKFKPVREKEEYSIEKFHWKITELKQGKTIESGGKKIEIFYPGEYKIEKVNPSYHGLKETWATGSLARQKGSSGEFFELNLGPRKSIDGLSVLYKVYGIGEDGLGHRYFSGPKKESATKGKFYSGIPVQTLEQLKAGIATKEKPIPNFFDLSGDFGNCRLEGKVDVKGGKKPEKLVSKLISYTNIGNDEYVLDYFAGSGTTSSVAFKKGFKFLTVEASDYFDSKVIVRLKHTLNGTSGGIESIKNNGIIKYIRLESYEDTLNNLKLIKNQSINDLFLSNTEQVHNDYLLNYMLDVETRNSILNMEKFKNPFRYEMKIATDSIGSSEIKNVDLVETFNYLIGLSVKSIESNVERGYVRIEGTLPTGDRTLILWRDCDKIGYDKLNDYANRFDLYAKEQTFDVIYINGDHNLPTAFTVDGEGGEVMRSLKLRQIEPEFLSLMFAEEA
ncbi:site-specific DNA-methyltransferase [Vibrio diabolicus]|uniref:DNA methyltransferase n=1 Tax=Vibrio diabolicus TaxID=50719 RepID=UPI0037529451